MANAKTVAISKSDFVEKTLFLNGHKFSLNDYPHMRAIYNSPYRDIVMQFSRQTSKSTSLANLMIANSAMIPNFKSLYVSPTVDQTKVFSHDRIAPVIEGSPFIKHKYVNTKLVQNVFMKQFVNGSKMYLRYALLNADRLRGYSSDMNLYDECQDLLPDIIPIANQSMSRSMHKKTLFAGTPKRSRGTLADLFNDSTKNEWMVKCHNSPCNKWNYLDEENVGEMGTVCRYCKKSIDTRKHGRWVSTGDPTSPMQGFRVSILMFDKAPWVDWQKEVIDFRKRNSPAVFYNEVLGLPYDDGISLISEADIRACCTGDAMTQVPTGATSKRVSYLGVDYGPINSNNSNTVVVAIQKMPGGIPKVVFAKKYLGIEADHAHIMEDIPRLKNVWGARLIGADHGYGEGINSQIRKQVGYEHLIAYQHMPNQNLRVKYNHKIPAYTTNRTQVIMDFAQRIKDRKIIFPPWQYTKDFAEDILNMSLEYTENNKVKIINTGPDDFAHACIYGLLAMELDSQPTYI